MSDKRMKLRQRRQAYRRLHGEKKAVSPVVATLILILIAVAAAAALYLWLVVWQGNLTKGIGQPGAQATLTIGGSTSVYPFSSLAASWFEANNSDTVISDNQGGTGAGMLAVCSGAVDIGAASSLETPAGLVASDACPSSDLNTIQVSTIAYDAVDVIVQNANPHGLVSISYDTLAYVYATQTVGATPTLVPNSINEAAFPTGYTTSVTAGALAWDQIPAAVAGTKVGTTTENTTGISVGASAVTCSGAPNDICANAGATPCGWSVCAGGSGTALATASIVTVARSDASGTTQTFEARVLGATSSTKFDGTTSSLAAATASFTGLGFSGCGSNNLIADCGYVADTAASGNPGVITAVADNQNAIGYASDGLARAATSGVTCQNTATAACGIGLQAPGQSAAVQPGLGSSGSIAGGIVNGGFGPTGLTTTLTIAQSYAGARPFEFVSLQPYTGVAQEFLTFIQDPANNIALAAATGEVSVYSV